MSGAQQHTINNEVEHLRETAEQYLEQFQYDAAIDLFQRALNIQPYNTSIMDDLADAFVQAGHHDQAKQENLFFGFRMAGFLFFFDVVGMKQVLSKSISINPTENYQKYMSLAQLLQGIQAINCYLQGIDMIKSRIQMLSSHQTQCFPSRHQNDDDEEEEEEEEDETVESLSKKVATAFTSIAEIYLTDSCFEDSAETECEKYLRSALEWDSSNMFTHQVFASFYLSANNPPQALIHLNTSNAIFLAKNNNYDKGDGLYSFRVTTGRLYIELAEFKSALEVLEPLLGVYDQDAELYFLLSLSNFHLNRPHTAQPYIQKAQNLIQQELTTGDGVSQLKQSIDDLSQKIVHQCESDHNPKSEEDNEVEHEDEVELDDVED